MDASLSLVHGATLKQVENPTTELTHELMRAKERAEQADRCKTVFVSIVSHELRTLLNAIMGFTDVIRQGLSGPVTTLQAEQLAIVQHSSQTMLDLINELLDMSRIESGRLCLEIEAFDFAELVRRHVLALQVLSARKGLALTFITDAELPVVTSDPKRVGQIITNLVSNAIKYTTSGSVSVTLARSGDCVQVSVQDTGPGISEGDLTRIFLPYEQGTDARSRRDSAGLGLPIAKQLAQALGGDIEVHSEPGCGACFVVRIPIHAPGANDENIVEHPQLRLAGIA
jgi:signal transduction histidine kinase